MNKDPFAKREAEKYSNPIPSREFILSIFNTVGLPISFNQLKKELMLHDEQREFALRKRLRAMVRDGQLDKIHKNYCLKGFVNQYNKDQQNKIHNADSFATVGSKDQIKKTVGKLFQVNGFNYVVPFFSKDLPQDVLIPLGNEGEAKIGDAVVLEVIMPVFKWADPIGKVLKVLGKAEERNVVINMSILSLDIPSTWSAEVKKQVAETKEHTIADIESRVDLRQVPFVTIDGEDAKDFDDAVFCEENSRGGWNLYVAIADVSYYIESGSSVDNQALLRGNSLYFPGKVVPMLPELFSNELCSLKANVDRLSMVCEMHISKSGKLSKYKFYEAVICSKARLTYNQVSALLQDNKNSRTLEKSVVDNLLELQNLFIILQEQRQERGAIEFETTESKMVFNSKGEVIDIKPIKRNVAHKIIEECMLCANVATARFLEKNKLLSIYRVHEGPTPAKLIDLKAFLKSVGLSLESSSQPTPKDYSKLLQTISNRKDADVIQMILLRSMCQAMYSSDNIGHFGLAYPAYTHFTSPIRRYTDLLVHRHIKAVLHNEVDKISLLAEKIKEIAEHCSMTERRADDAAREVTKACKCQYLSKFIGSKFVGIISGVTKFGLFVELKDIYIDGLIHINSLGSDYFIHDPLSHKLVGEKSGVIYSLGMELQIVVSKVDLDRRRIDFVLAIDMGAKKRSSKKARSKKSKAKKSGSIKSVKIKTKK
jgi:ribonuclease R